MPVDLLFTAHNRLEYTRQSVAALIQNTDWSLVRRIFVCDDESVDGTGEFLESVRFPVDTIWRRAAFGGPVAVMNQTVEMIGKDALLAKVDNDTMLPKGWLNVCMDVMAQHPGLDLLGIEAMFPVNSNGCKRELRFAPYIGGIGLMRTRAFNSLPEPQGRFGFTAWQDQHPEVTKAWLNPSIPVCLLDRVPLEPWYSLSRAYVAKRWQRPWKPYDLASSALWEWWA